MTVDEFVETKVPLELRPIVAAIRSLAAECAPDAEELISYGMPVYRGRKIFAWFTATRKEVTLGFSRGTQLEDRYGLLRGAAKGGSRHVRLKSLADVRKPALKYYIKQAAKLDKN